jgi:hypothetical protein
MLEQTIQELVRELKIATMKLMPGAAGGILYRLTLEQWVAVVTIIYFVIQIIILLPKLFITVRGFFNWLRK